MNKIKVLAVVYMICAISAFLFFFGYSFDMFLEERASLEAQWEAETGMSAGFFDYFWPQSVHSRNVFYFGLALLAVGAFLAMAAGWSTLAKPTKK